MLLTKDFAEKNCTIEVQRLFDLATEAGYDVFCADDDYGSLKHGFQLVGVGTVRSFHGEQKDFDMAFSLLSFVLSSKRLQPEESGSIDDLGIDADVFNWLNWNTKMVDIDWIMKTCNPLEITLTAKTKDSDYSIVSEPVMLSEAVKMLDFLRKAGRLVSLDQPGALERLSNLEKQVAKLNEALKALSPTSEEEILADATYVTPDTATSVACFMLPNIANLQLEDLRGKTVCEIANLLQPYVRAIGGFVRPSYSYENEVGENNHSQMYPAIEYCRNPLLRMVTVLKKSKKRGILYVHYNNEAKFHFTNMSSLLCVLKNDAKICREKFPAHFDRDDEYDADTNNED